MLQRIKKKLQNSEIHIQTKLLLVFLFTMMILFSINIYMYLNVNHIMSQINSVYAGNARLNELQSTIGHVQSAMTDYMNLKNSDSMEDYFHYSQKYSELLEPLNSRIVDDELLLMEKNIRMISQSYLELSEQTIEYRRGHNVIKYKKSYEEASELFTYIDSLIYDLNNKCFQKNVQNYEAFMENMKSVETMNLVILCLTGLLSMSLIAIMTQEITKPLRQLAYNANQVSAGNLDVELVEVKSQDEVAIVSVAFNQMVVSIREYIERLKKSMELERTMKENELRMEADLKDARLKYLQAQINPHFLFNTLNAGAQLAMMEDAEKTYRYIQNVADFFRYSVRKNYGDVALQEEIKLVDHYIYILNVRFSGEIHFQKDVDDTLTSVKIPVMTLQPIVENAVNHGIRGLEREGRIELSVYREGDKICVRIADNGVGMSDAKIQKVMTGSVQTETQEKDSNGIGLDNVIRRLRLFYGKEDVFFIRSEGEDKGTEVLICIPLDLR